MLPKAADMPAVPPQSGGNITVAGDIARDFVLPKLSVRLWDLPVFRAAVPKAAVNKHGDARRGKSKVGIAEQGILNRQARGRLIKYLFVMISQKLPGRRKFAGCFYFVAVAFGDMRRAL